LPATTALADVRDPYHGAVGVDLAVVVVTYNSAPVVGQLLDTIPAALGGISADVVVVDNGSTDETLTVLASRTDCRVVRSTNLGYSAGINRGVGEAEPADAILILNPDVLLRPGSVRPLLEALQLSHVGVAAPKVLMADGTLHWSLRRDPTLLRAVGLHRSRLAVFSEHVTNSAAYENAHDVDWALGAALMVSRTCYEELGGWDESFFLYSEETQFCLDARSRGFRVRYVPESIVVHLLGQSGRSGLTHSMMVVNRVRMYRRRHNALASWCYFWITVLIEFSRLIRGQERSRQAIMSLLRPGRRPTELGCSRRLMPS
jgi:N-acetylglucosaminyl-diphospho-decaprenol L-rhamnosyltransferase